MRVRKISVLALATVAAGLSLSACNNDSTDGASSATTTTSSASTAGPSASTGTGQDGTTGVNGGQKGSSGSTTSGTGTGTHSGTSTTCQTAHLAFSSSHGMGEGDYLINIKNTGAHTCTMHGFPGADLKGKDGTVSATRSTLAAPHVILQPGQETHFDLRYPPNLSGGSGVTFTTLIVTPPNETHSHTMPLTINVPVSDSAGPGITVDPVGAGK